MTCTCALITSVSFTVKPSSTFDSSINFFQPQSCSFLQKRCSVSAGSSTSSVQLRSSAADRIGLLSAGLAGVPVLLIPRAAPEYLLFFGSLLTTAIVNCAKWLQPADTERLLLVLPAEMAPAQLAGWQRRGDQLQSASDRRV
jgi:hypothetical protein